MFLCDHCCCCCSAQSLSRSPSLLYIIYVLYKSIYGTVMCIIYLIFNIYCIYYIYNIDYIYNCLPLGCLPPVIVLNLRSSRVGCYLR